MAKKTTAKDRHDPTQRRVTVRLNPDLAQRLERYLEGVKPKTNLTAVMTLALEEYLDREGKHHASR